MQNYYRHTNTTVFPVKLSFHNFFKIQKNFWYFPCLLFKRYLSIIMAWLTVISKLDYYHHLNKHIQLSVIHVQNSLWTAYWCYHYLDIDILLGTHRHYYQFFTKPSSKTSQYHHQKNSLMFIQILSSSYIYNNIFIITYRKCGSCYNGRSRGFFIYWY